MNRAKGVDRYALAEEGDGDHHHPHFVCDSCSRVACLPAEVGSSIAMEGAWAASIQQAALQLRAGIALLGRVYDDPREIARSHDPLIEALRARDAERLRRELREHLEDARIHVIQLYRGDAG